MLFSIVLFIIRIGLFLVGTEELVDNAFIFFLFMAGIGIRSWKCCCIFGLIGDELSFFNLALI